MFGVRVYTDALGRASGIYLPVSVITALGWSTSVRGGAGTMLSVSVEGDVLRAWPDLDGRRRVYRHHSGSSAAVKINVGPELRSLGGEPLERITVRAEVEEDGVLIVHLRQPLSAAQVTGLRAVGDGDPLRMPGDRPPKRTLILSLEDELHARLTTEAAALQLSLSGYTAHLLRHADRSALPLPDAATERQRGQVVRMARLAGHRLSAAELMKRGQSPASDEQWLRAQIAAGEGYTSLARRYGGSPGTYQRWGRRYGLVLRPGAIRG